MRDQGIWSIGLGRWNGVQVRLHMFFLIFAAFAVYLGWLDAETVASTSSPWIGLICVSVLLGSVIVHELGHLLVANRLGASVNELVLGPLGGLGPPPRPLEPQGELLTAVAGPLSNMGLCLLSASFLVLHGGVDVIGLLNPVAPSDISGGAPLVQWLKLTLWVNWLLVLVNMIPAFPFDGGRAVRAGIMIMHPRGGPQRAIWIVTRIAKLTALVLIVLAMFGFGAHPEYSVQTWLALILLAIFVYFSAKKEESLALHAASEDALFGYDFSAGYTSLEQSGPKCSTKPLAGPLVRWWDRRREARLQRRREVEAMEDGRVDEILERVHESGLENLSSDDRELLHRVSARYRTRVE